MEIFCRIIHWHGNIIALFHDAEKKKMTVLYLAIPFFLVLYGVVSWLRRKKLPYPPGPMGLPIIGNMLMMGQLTHRGLADLAQQYGGLLHLRMGFLHVVSVSTADVARQVLQVQDNVFSNRPATAAIDYLSYSRADMAFANNGPFWRQMRKLCVVKLFSRRRAESWDSVRSEVDSAIMGLAARSGREVDVTESAFSLMKNITYRAAFGSGSKEGQEEFIGIVREFSILLGAFNITDFLPCLGWADLQGLNARLVKARLALDVFIDRIIDDHIAKNMMKNIDGGSDGCEETDMVDELLSFYHDGNEDIVSESDDPRSSIRLTRDNIKAIIMDVMFGGIETVASAIEWAMAELLGSPKELRKAQQELEEVVGLTRRVEESDFEKLTYLKCCLKETLRLHPPIPLLPHATAEATEVSGYYIPAKTRVLVNVWAIGRDRSTWEDPEAFRPARFLQPGVPDFKGNHFEFLPFGSGRRSCPGMQLGLYAFEQAVAQLLHCFTWELPEGMKPSELDMSDEFGLTAPRATRLVAVPTPRLLCSLC